MDHYKVLGVNRDASKESIKQAFRKLAVEFHPDKHANSPPHVRERATLKFKHLSHAYETLMDDRKRADFNIRSSFSSNPSSSSYHWNRSYYRDQNPGGDHRNSGGCGYNYGYTRSGRASYINKLEMLLRLMTARTSLLHLTFAGLLLGASVAIDSGGKALWEMHNSGKSFEDAMDSIDNAKG
ncbi:unnamed protein product [Cuscuta campestris]|uniref:J domain-containing protein n=1 Tax=Cuscuta campestris TaxID=132261 RepID=A0A484KF28_9ASTE|nr:unnamed protein product [Cuscuta campestris]